MNPRTAMLVLSAMIAMQEQTGSVLFGNKRRERKYEPCPKCGKLTKDEVCFTCKQKEPTNDN